MHLSLFNPLAHTRWEQHPAPIPDDLDGVKEEIVQMRAMLRRLKKRISTTLPKADINYQVGLVCQRRDSSLRGIFGIGSDLIIASVILAYIPLIVKYTLTRRLQIQRTMR